MGSFSKASALVRSKRTWLLVAVFAWVLVGFAPMLEAIFRAVAHPAFWVGVVAYYSALFGLVRAWKRWWREERGSLTAGEAGLSIGGRLVLPRSEVRLGYVLRRTERVYVRLARRLRHVEIEVADEAEGEALLSAMRLDPERSVAHYPMTNGTWRASFVRAAASTLPVLIAPVLAYLLGGGIPLLLGSLLGASVLTCLYAFDQYIRVSVGADGIRMSRLLHSARFVPFAAIAGAESKDKNVAIRLHSGELLRMHYPQSTTGKRGRLVDDIWSDPAFESQALVERIEAHLAARRARANVDAPVFARAGRDTDEWLREVAGATDANATYRTPAVPPEELWRIVEDTAAAPTARAGAAAALREALDDEGRVRLRAAADACAAPRLRVALETVALETDDADLRSAFEPLDDHEAPKRRAIPL